jgi:predicted transcriptional regulator
MDKKELLTAIARNTEDLHQKIEMHRDLVANILEHKVDGDLLKDLCSATPSSPADRRLKEVIGETIEVLEQSRKAFKSKRLEALRKKLTQVLIDHG